MKAKKAKWILGIALLSIPLAPICYVAVYDGQTASRKQVAFNKLKALGYPITIEDYKKSAPPLDQNAAPLVKQLLAEWKELQDDESKEPLDKLTPQKIEFIKTNHQFFSKLERLSTYSEMWIEQDLSEEWDSVIPLGNFKAIARTQALAMVLDAKSGRHELARRRFFSVRAMEQLLANGNLMNVLTAIALEAILARHVVNIIAETPDLAERQRWRAAFVKQPLHPDLRTVFTVVLIYMQHPWGDLEGLELESYAPIDRPFAKHPSVQERARLLCLEDVVDIAELADDGEITQLDAQEALRRSEQRRRSETLARPLGDLVPVTNYRFLAADYNSSKTNRELACIDVLIEQAGGPKAVAGPGTRISRLPSGIEVRADFHRAYYVISGGKVTSKAGP